MNDFAFRFGGLARLYGAAGLERLRAAHVLVVGIGGVGSWTVEALARSGIGALTLVDLDEVCVSNVNRQLAAIEGTIGKAKVEVMAERIRGIHPECRVTPTPEFFTADSAERLLTPAAGQAPFSYVVDAIDAVANKCRLIARCRAMGLGIVACGGAGGRRDATQVRVLDLARVTNDRLLSEVRKRLRKEFGFPRGDCALGVDCVCSAELPVAPRADGTVGGWTGKPAAPEESRRLNCDRGLGSATFVTGTFGFAAAGHVVSRIVEAVGTSRSPTVNLQPALPLE